MGRLHLRAEKVKREFFDLWVGTLDSGPFPLVDMESRMRPGGEILYQGLRDLSLGEEHPQDLVSEELSDDLITTDDAANMQALRIRPMMSRHALCGA